jgi:CRP/FNR family transcriptional regulator, anaerobic regulatory protein
VEAKVAGKRVETSFSGRETGAPLVPVFAPALSACVGFLGTLPSAKFVKASTTLIQQGELVKKVKLVQSGLVKLINLNPEGRETLIGLRSVGWYAGSASLILNTPSIYSVWASTDCTVVEIAASDFLRCLSKSPEMLDHFILGLCREVVSYTGLHVEFMSCKAEDRMNLFLHERAAAYATGEILDPLPLLKQIELAQLISITPEHFSRLKKRGKFNSTPRNH